jgi:hypothetical protein
METMLSNSIATPRLRATLVALFAGLALLLAMAGMYERDDPRHHAAHHGVRLRLALGASSRNVIVLDLTACLDDIKCSTLFSDEDRAA